MTGSDFSSALTPLIILFWVGIGCIPLGVWKLVEIIIWCWKHINIQLS